uniref:Uncharacterized protein n=1 Tax=Noccaea caerulescens TaxID=107243 RepID=A0A1J3IU04_NOCCA
MITSRGYELLAPYGLLDPENEILYFWSRSCTKILMEHKAGETIKFNLSDSSSNPINKISKFLGTQRLFSCSCFF